mgnify:CR=1 FL=1
MDCFLTKIPSLATFIHFVVLLIDQSFFFKMAKPVFVDVAEKFFEACETGKGAGGVADYVAADSTFKAQVGRSSNQTSNVFLLI